MSHRLSLLRPTLLIVFVVVCTWTAATVVAQSNDIVVNLTVKTKDGSTVEGLKAENFSVSVDKVRQQIVSFETSGLPASVGIVIDDSTFPGSGYYRLASKLVEVLRGFLEASNKSNDYFTLAFNTQTRLLQDWTSDRELVTSNINQLAFKGNTALYDALYTSIQKVSTGRHSRHVIIVLSDGQDGVSTRSFNELRNALKNSDVVLYAVGIMGSADAGSALGMEGQGVLDEIARVSGGAAFFPKPAEMRRVFEFIAKEIGSQYRLVINPEPVAAKKWRKISVKATMRDSAGKLIELRVRSRTEFQQ